MRLQTIFLLALLYFARVDSYNAQSKWKEIESENFKIIFKEEHSHLIPKLLSSAENSFNKIKEVFNYELTEKIIINTYDVYDYGFATATAVPQNFIRLEIEPFEPGYEIVPYNDRLQWVLSHEIIHVVVNDLVSDVEKFSRSIFSKVAPEQAQPLTILYSLLTNFNRYTPRWHQESIAVFGETWLSGGFGRLLGNFDEMYFRTLVLDGREFYDIHYLDAIATHNSFLLESLFYLYGSRFTSHLSQKFGKEKLIDWFIPASDNFYSSFISNFEKIYGVDFYVEWENFIAAEIEFQRANIEKLKSAELTKISPISEDPLGWVSQPYLNKNDSTIIFASHGSHHLASIKKLDLKDSSIIELSSLPSPSMHQVASTAFDNQLGLFFFTTNNNMLYRDVWVLDVNTCDKKLLFKDLRIGNLTIAESTHELWGIRHLGGKAILVYSKYPYNQVLEIVSFDVGDEIYNISVNPSGDKMAVVIHRANGEQSLAVADIDAMKRGGGFTFKTVSKSGSPESPSWSADGKEIYWNAYINGVSNIYKYNLDNTEITPLSHTLRGLVKPIKINDNSIFAFEFKTDGFIPVELKNQPASYLPAIEYHGQKIIEKNPELIDWKLTSVKINSFESIEESVTDYEPLSELKVLAFVPIISGFQKQKTIGFYSRISDPLITHDLTLELAYSPFDEMPNNPKWHFRLKYDYRKRFEFGIDHNAPDFYDLFNDRKRGMIGTKIRMGYNHYWVYDNPHKVNQRSEIAYYTGVEFLNDNLVRVSQPDFFVAQTSLNSKYLRRTIGSSDYEYGNDFKITLMTFGADQDEFEFSGQLYGEWDNYSLWLANHNVMHLKLAAGYAYDNVNLAQARFYFGGFGNRVVDNENVKQFRKVFRFPGVPIYSLSASKFAKVMLENNLPPLRFKDWGSDNHYLSHIDASIYSQVLLLESYQDDKWIDLGGQINFIFKHWYNLESTISFGCAKAWAKNTTDWEWFFSLKLLKN